MASNEQTELTRKMGTDSDGEQDDNWGWLWDGRVEQQRKKDSWTWTIVMITGRTDV